MSSPHTEPGSAPKSGAHLTEVRIHAVFDGVTWEVDVEVDGESRGGGTGPSKYDILSLAGSVLFGDTNDHLNDDYGALGGLS